LFESIVLVPRAARAYPIPPRAAKLSAARQMLVPHQDQSDLLFRLRVRELVESLLREVADLPKA